MQKLIKIHGTDENGNIVITYPNRETTSIKVTTSKPEQIGTLKFHHTKVIEANTDYTKNQLRNVQFLEEKVMVNEEEANLKMALLETTSQAKLEMNKTELSTLEENSNVEIVATLQANQNTQELYKNPSVEIVFPERIGDIHVNTINLLNAEEFKVAQAILGDIEGKKVITLKLEGEQVNYTSKTKEGVQIVINANIQVQKDTPTSDAQIYMNYTNENDLNRDKKQVTKDVKMVSKQGMMVYSKVEGYNQAGEVQESVDKTTLKAQLDIQSASKVAKVERTIINNYGTDIQNVSIIGKLSNQEEQISEDSIKSTYKATLQGAVQTNFENAKISYSQDNGQTWQERVENLDQVTNFKLDIPEGKLKQGETIKLSYGINVPEKLEYLDASYEALQVNYKNDEQEIKDDYCTQFQVTQLKEQETGTNTIALEDLDDSFEKAEGIGQVSIKAISGGKELQEGEEIFEGQTIKYIVTIVNDTEQPLENINIVAKHTNSIFLDKEVKQELNTATGGQMDVTRIVENPALTQKELTIDSIGVGEKVSCEYEFVVKEDAAGQSTAGTIEFTTNSTQKTISTITNQIKEAKLKLTTRYAYNEEVEVYGNGGFDTEIVAKDIGEENLHDVILEVKVPENSEFNKIIFFNTEDYELIEYNEEIVKIKIKELQSQQEMKIYVSFNLDRIPYDILETKATISCNATIEDNMYVSNELIKTVKQRETNITISQTGNIERNYVVTGDNLIYKAVIKNEGLLDANMTIQDNIPTGAIVQKAYIIQDNEKTEIETSESNYVQRTVSLEKGDTIEFFVETLIDETRVLESPISNIVTVVGREGGATSNEISYIVGEYYEQPNPDNPDPDNPDPDNPDPDNPDPDNPDPDNPDPDNPDPDNPDPDNPDPDNPNPDKNKSSISGIVWIDKNKDGERQGNEKTIENLEVSLLDAQTGNQKETTKTDGQGKYDFNSIENGEYIVKFNYDTSIYELTQYKKEGVEEYLNSDVVTKQMDGRQVAVTDTIKVTGDEYVVDAGFIEGQIFDLKLDKYVKSVTVQNSAGRRVINYDKSKLAKVELDAKSMVGSTLLVEYEIAITNEGELPGYVNDIIDYLPQDMAFDATANKSWSLSKDNNLHNVSLANEVINPGETKTTTLILTVSVSENTGGSIKNIAEIGQSSNSKLTVDTDSTAGNKKQEEDDLSSAEIIISVRTGIGVVISIGTIIAICIVIGIITYKKKKEGKSNEE